MDSSQTVSSFNQKWTENPKLAFDATVDTNSDIHGWILNRNGFNTETDFIKWCRSKNRILDAGCGNGRVTNLFSKCAAAGAQIVGIDYSPEVAIKNLANNNNVTVGHADLTQNLAPFGTFDLVYCQEVLHHTSEPFLAFSNLVDILNENGEIAIYVYKKKGPIREFSDEYIRDQLKTLTWDEANNQMLEITKLGKLLSELQIEIEVDEIELLGIKKGKYDLQRFIYHYFLKCFWNEDLDFQESVAINTDWYLPQIASKHTMAEVSGWALAKNLEIIHLLEDEYGITMRAKRFKKIY